jgi:hypothetical protein
LIAHDQGLVQLVTQVLGVTQGDAVGLAVAVGVVQVRPVMDHEGEAPAGSGDAVAGR